MSHDDLGHAFTELSSRGKGACGMTGFDAGAGAAATPCAGIMRLTCAGIMLCQRGRAEEAIGQTCCHVVGQLKK